jgi:acetylglutamate kinase
VTKVLYGGWDDVPQGRHGSRSAAIAADRVQRHMVVLKLGGELLERRSDRQAIARIIARSARGARLVVVHGGGKEIDAALALAALPKHQVDGLRVTDEATLDVVVSVLAGAVNTRLVAAINAVAGRAVGVTAADAGVTTVRLAKPHRATNGELVDPGLVGEPVPGTGAPLLEALCRSGFTPVLASIGARGGQLLNVNADTLAGTLAARLTATRLVIAGGTPGVLDAQGAVIDELDADAADGLISTGTANAGMVAKLRACRTARESGVREVVIADGRGPQLATLLTGTSRGAGRWTRLT